MEQSGPLNCRIFFLLFNCTQYICICICYVNHQYRERQKGKHTEQTLRLLFHVPLINHQEAHFPRKVRMEFVLVWLVWVAGRFLDLVLESVKCIFIIMLLSIIRTQRLVLEHMLLFWKQEEEEVRLFPADVHMNNEDGRRTLTQQTRGHLHTELIVVLWC